VDQHPALRKIGYKRCWEDAAFRETALENKGKLFEGDVPAMPDCGLRLDAEDEALLALHEASSDDSEQAAFYEQAE